MDTASIPGTVKRRGMRTWDGNMCINFAAGLLDCEFTSSFPVPISLCLSNLCPLSYLFPFLFNPPSSSLGVLPHLGGGFSFEHLEA